MRPLQRFTVSLARSLVSLLAALPGIAPAQTQGFDNGVPRDLVSVLAGGIVYEGFPGGFPPFTLPAGMELVGSIDKSISFTTVIRTNVDPLPVAGTAIRQALIANGWIELPVQNPMVPPQRFGFVPAGGITVPPPRPADLCRDDTGILTIQVPEQGLWLNLNTRRALALGSDFSCAAQAAQLQQMNNRAGRMGRDPNNGMQRFMPTLELPAPTPAPATAAGMQRFMDGGSGGFSGSDTDIETQASTRTSMTPQQLLTHFSTQMQAQGWTEDSSNSGSVTGQSSWTRAGEGGQQLAALLSLIKSSADTYTLKLRVVVMGASANNGNTPALGIRRAPRNDPL